MWLRSIMICIFLSMVVSAIAADSNCQTITNIALGKPVTVTVSGNDGTLAYEGESLTDITDGSLAYVTPSQRQEDGCVGWRNSRSGGTMTVTVTINLQASYQISCIRYNCGNTSNANTWSADTMTTPFGTTDINPGNPGVGAWTTHYGDTTASSITITLTKKNSGTNRDWLFIGEIEVYAVGLPPDSMLLNVAFMKQFFSTTSCPDGGHGSCGPASLSMCCCYVLGRTPVPQDIINVWAYLGRDTCGNDSSGTSFSELVSAGKSVFGLSKISTGTFTLQQLKNEIAAGRPVLVHVQAGYLSNRGYSYTGGHYIVAIGYDANNIICNDPGTYAGAQKYYSNSDMTSAMAAKSNGVIRNFMK